jgi:hypothetical protein
MEEPQELKRSRSSSRPARRRGRAVVVALAVLVAAGAGGFLATTPAASSPTPPPGLEFGVHDPSTGAHLSLQADPSADSYGSFTIATPDLGVVWATAAAAMSGDSPVLQLRYDGSGYLDKNASIDPETGSDYVLSGGSETVSLRIVGHVNTTTHQGVVNYWVGGDHHQLNSSGPAGAGSSSAVMAVADEYVAALLAHDAGAVYDLMDWQTRTSVTRDTFMSTTGTDPDFVGITAASLRGTPSVASNDGGVTYATIDISVTSRGSATGGKLTLVWDRGAWKVYGVR